MFYFYMWLKFLNLKEWHKNCLLIFYCQRICLLIRNNTQTVLKIFFWSKRFVCDLIWTATCNYPRSTASLSECIINLESFSILRLILWLCCNRRKIRCCKGEVISTRSHNYLEAEMEDKYKAIIGTSISSFPPLQYPLLLVLHAIQFKVL